MTSPLDHLVILASFHARKPGCAKAPAPGYRPHLRVGESDMLGIQVLDGPQSVIADVPFEALVECVYPGVDYSALTVGAEFSIMEGPTRVGRGTVISVLHRSNLRKT